VWNIVYDPSKDEVLVWTDNRVRIFRRRGRRQFVYLKGKNDNTFPCTSLPLTGHWQGSYFIANHIAHRQTQPTKHVNHVKIVMPKPNKNLSALNGSSQRHHELHQNTLSQINGHKQRPQKQKQTHYQPTKNDSHTPNEIRAKAFKATRKTMRLHIALILIWTKRHLDAYLATAEIFLEQNVDPG
jgi:hypothetical protein